jgi:hypothetical protein
MSPIQHLQTQTLIAKILILITYKKKIQQKKMKFKI